MANKPVKKTTPKKKTATPARKTASAPIKQYSSNKPLFSTVTIVTLVVFLAVIAAAFYISRKNKTEAAEATPTGAPSFVFTAADGVPSNIKVEPAEGQAVELGRNAQNAWELIQPEKAEADQGAVEAATSQLTAIEIVREIEGDASIFGLDNPTSVISVTFADGKPRTLEIGDSTPTNSGYYARLDKKKMMIVSLSGIDALTNLASFPPYLNTPTPTALPATETPVPAPDTPSVTPTP